MAISTSLSNGTRTVVLTYQGPTVKVVSLLTDAARWLHDIKGLYHIYSEELERDLLWDELSNAQKLGVIDQGVRHQLLKWSRDYYFNMNIPAAQQGVVDIGETTYELNE